MLVRLISFLQEELKISAPEIALAQRQGEAANLLPMILWQYGLLTLEQLDLDRVFNWLETARLLNECQSILDKVEGAASR